MRDESRKDDGGRGRGREEGMARVGTYLQELLDGLDELLAGHTQEVIGGQVQGHLGREGGREGGERLISESGDRRRADGRERTRGTDDKIERKEGGREGRKGRTYLGELDALGGVVLGDLVDLVPPVDGVHVLQLVLLLELLGREGGGERGKRYE